jgi:30S ribosome assembly GTPase
MSKLSMARRCYSCGAVLQNDNPDKDGYISDAALLETPLDRVLFCDKCYHEVDYSHIQSEPSLDPDFLTMMRDAAASDALIVYVVDLINFETSFNSILSSIIKNNPILILANKRDLLPAEAKDEDLKEYVAHRFRVASLPIKAEQVILTSLASAFDCGPLAQKIEAERRRHDVYIIGAAGCGKSLFFTSFLRSFSNISGRAIVTSVYPGTTLRIMQVPLDNNSYLYDTPGTSISNSTLSRLEASISKDLMVGGPYKSRKMSLEVGSGFFIGGLAFVELTKGENKKENLQVYFPNTVSLKKFSSLDKAEGDFEKGILKRVFTPTSALLRNVKDMDVIDIVVDETGSRDIGISGLGWFSFIGNKQSFRLYVPRGVSIYTSRSKIKLC